VRVVAGFVLAAVLCLGVSGCATAAFGRTENYSAAWPAVPYTCRFEVSVLVSDQRADVLSGKKAPTFVGVTRGGYGNPFSMKATSGRPLVDDLTTAIVEGLKNTGAVASGATPAEKDARRARDSKTVLLLVQVHEWASDTYSTTDFSYDLSIAAYDSTGKLLGDGKVAADSQRVNSSIEAGRKALTELLAGPQVASALGDREADEPSGALSKRHARPKR
jgi:hypothetical protein